MLAGGFLPGVCVCFCDIPGLLVPWCGLSPEDGFLCKAEA